MCPGNSAGGLGFIPEIVDVSANVESTFSHELWKLPQVELPIHPLLGSCFTIDFSMLPRDFKKNAGGFRNRRFLLLFQVSAMSFAVLYGKKSSDPHCFPVADEMMKVEGHGGAQLRNIKEFLVAGHGHSKAISSVKFAPDGQRLLTSSAYDGTARLWDVVSGNCHLVIPGDGKVVNDAVFSPDGQKVLLASASESLRIFDAENGECVLTLTGHDDWVRSAAFSPDGTIIGSSSYDGTVRLWSVTGKCLKVLEGHDGAVISVAFIEG
eukprot:s2247_g4.t1